LLFKNFQHLLFLERIMGKVIRKECRDFFSADNGWFLHLNMVAWMKALFFRLECALCVRFCICLCCAIKGETSSAFQICFRSGGVVGFFSLRHCLVTKSSFWGNVFHPSCFISILTVLFWSREAFPQNLGISISCRSHTWGNLSKASIFKIKRTVG
jgi:hypothetical protein